MNKSKFFKRVLPCIIIVIFVGIFVAATVVYALTFKDKTITVENGAVTVDALNGYIDKISDELNTNADDIMVVNGSRFDIAGGNIDKMSLEICFTDGSKTQYWQIQGGNNMQSLDLIYIDTVKNDDSGTWVITLPSMAKYINGINGALPLTAYTAKSDYTSNYIANGIAGEGYIWQDDHFELLLQDSYGLFYSINVTDGNAQNYVFYIN